MEEICLTLDGRRQKYQNCLFVSAQASAQSENFGEAGGFFSFSLSGWTGLLITCHIKLLYWRQFEEFKVHNYLIMYLKWIQN